MTTNREADALRAILRRIETAKPVVLYRHGPLNWWGYKRRIVRIAKEAEKIKHEN